MASFIRSCVLINKSYPQTNKSIPWSLIYFFLIALHLFFITTTLFAENHLQDNAKVVSQDMADKLEKELVNIDNQENFHLEVVILPHFYNRSPEAVVNAYIDQLSKNAPTVNKRALLLIVLNNNLVILRQSEELTNVYNATTSKEIIDNVKRNLTSQNYDEMARIGVAGMAHHFHQAFPKKGNETNKSEGWKKILNIVIFFVVLIAVIVLITYKQKKSPKL